MNFSLFSTVFFNRWTLWIGTVILPVSLILRFKIKNICWSLWWYCIDYELYCSSSAADSTMGPYSAVLLLRFLLKIRSVRILDTIICSVWIQSYVLWHCICCSLLPGTQLNSPCKLASSVLWCSLTLPIKVLQLWLSRPYAWPSTTVDGTT